MSPPSRPIVFRRRRVQRGAVLLTRHRAHIQAHIPARIHARVLAVLVSLAGLAYALWLLEFVLPTGINHTEAFLSELEEPGHPYATLFQDGDVFTGSCLALAALIALATAGRGAWARLTYLYGVSWLALGLFAASTIWDSQSPLSDKETVGRGLLPQLHQLHALTSTLAITFVFVGIIGFTVLAYRRDRFPLLRRWGLTMLIILVATTVWLAVGDNIQQATGARLGLGAIQRVQVGAISAWFLVFGVALWREPQRVARRLAERRGAGDEIIRE